VRQSTELRLGVYRGLEHGDPDYRREVYRTEPGFVYYRIDCGGGLWVDGGRTRWGAVRDFFLEATYEGER
jgi:hypothetical protein